MKMFSKGRFQSATSGFDGELLATQLEGRRRKRRYAYLAWLCLGSHYLYLGRRATQLLFWCTGGGLLLWWIADLFRIPDLVRRRNLALVRRELEQWHQTAGHTAPAPPVPQPVPSYPFITPAAEEPRNPAPPQPWQDLDQVPPAFQARFNSRLACGWVVAAGTVAIVAMYLLAPPPLAALAASEPAFTTARSVNLRERPSTASRPRAVIRKGEVLRGRVTPVQSQRWLFVTRGAHAGGYVALSNLKPS